MHFCYVDEAGCTGTLPSAKCSIQPVFVLAALFVPHSRLGIITTEFLKLKAQFYPGPSGQKNRYLDSIRREIKGSDLRRFMRSESRNERRATHIFMSRIIKLLEDNDVKLISRIFVKPIGAVFKGMQVYNSATQSLCMVFQRYLEEQDSAGIIIADSRTPQLNSGVSHSIFTQKYKTSGDPYAKILEMPVFGGSENHAAMQISDYFRRYYSRWRQ